MKMVTNYLGRKPSKKWVVIGEEREVLRRKMIDIFIIFLSWLRYEEGKYFWPKYATMKKCEEAAANEEEPDTITWKKFPLKKIYAEYGMYLF